MIELRKTDAFAKWLKRLRDVRALARIQVRIDRLALGNPGDVRPVGEGVSELRVDYGPGYRVYFVQRGRTLILLLCGGGKSTQDADIERIPKKLTDFFDQNSLQHIDLARFLIDRTIPFGRKAR